jgi:hypothetical protein
MSCLPDLETTTGTGVCGDGIIESGEQCDPGIDATVPGCAQCMIECGGDGGDAGTAWVDPTSNHCYFLLSKDSGPSEPATGQATGCSSVGAHVVTLGSSDELGRLAGNLVLPPSQEFWLGLRRDLSDDAGVIYQSVVDEPGFARHRVCSGCFGPSAEKDGGLLPYNRSSDSSPEPECVTWLLRTNPRWYATNCESNFPTICEREPVGSRRYSCGAADSCFTVLWDLSTSAPGKRYVWSPKPLTAQAASKHCAQLSDAGPKASLVVFESDEEREQVFYELMHLPKPPTDFWIGLRLEVQEGGPPEWTWDNGKNHTFYPPPWGDHEPSASKPGARAFAQQTSASYARPGKTYDTQLAHVPDGGDETELHSVLCQISP